MDADDLIQVRTYGEGPGPVVLVHGGPGAPGSLAALARSLAPDYAVLEPLQRASGPVPLSVEQHVADMGDALPKRFVLVGHSWGAMLALSFAAAHPGRAVGVALIGCGTYDLASRAAFGNAMMELVGSDELTRMNEEMKAAEGEEASRLFAEIGWVLSAAQRYDAVPAPDDVTHYDPQGWRETWDDAVRRQTEGIEPAAFEAIRVPVLMLHGADDPHPGPSTRDVLQAVMPQLEYVELAKCGHEPWLERQAREAFDAALRAWLDRLLPISA